MDMGRRPELKSDEKSKGTPIVIEKSRCEDYSQQKKCYTCSELHPACDAARLSARSTRSVLSSLPATE